MRNIAMFILLFFASVCAHAQTEGDCRGNMIQINDCMLDRLEKVEADLNRVYALVMKEFSKPDESNIQYSLARKELLSAQRAWVAFRKSDCDAVYTIAGGSVANMRLLACMEGHAVARTKELKEQFLVEER